ncbi:MAG: CPBP family intramembrane metalloprotease [Acetatifactor sp.]|nr:CPBP family intramembrane metalloprotease [Acetatifactor sp.]
MKNLRKWNVICYYLAYVIMHVLFSKVLSHLLKVPSAVGATMQLTSYAVLGLWGIWTFRRELAEGLKLWRDHFLKSMLWLVGGYVLDMVLMTVFSMPLAYGFPDYEGLNENSVAGLVGKYPGVILLLALGILGPVTEETIFRLFPVIRGKGKLPAALAICVPAACFMMIHVHALTAAELFYNLPHFATGLVYGFVLQKSRNATIPVLLHVLNNSVAILAMLLR